MHGGAQGLGDLPGALQDAVLEQDAEFVATDAGQMVAGSYRPPQNVGQLPEHLVAGQMPAGVVDDLELVQVEKQQAVPYLLVPGLF